jgi:uncharacterized protein (TIGR02246 family)
VLAPLFLCICCVISSSAQSASPEGLVDDIVEAWNSHNGEAFGRLFAEDAVLISRGEVVVEGRANIVKAWKTSTIVLSAKTVRKLRSDAALVLLRLITPSSDEQGEQKQGGVSAMLFVAIKELDGWRIAASQITKLSN